MIAGYCWPQSGLPDESITLFCHADTPSIGLEIVRSGSTPTTVLKKQSLSAIKQTMPDDLARNGCKWQPTFEIKIQARWPSGMYLVCLTDANGEQAHAFFVVRSPEPLDAMMVLATSTWSAYNTWGGPSFYTGGHASSAMRPLGRGVLHQAQPGRHRLSGFIDRTPADVKDMADARYNPWFLCAGWANWEYLFACWAESQGFRLGYATSQDLDRDRDLLTGYPAYISVGHDEYWSAGMRDTVEDYVDTGGNAAFFSGNVAYWQIRYEDDYNRLVSYKTQFQDDPMYNADSAPALSTMWSDPLVGRPENHMTGVSFNRGGYARMPNSPYGSGGYTVWQPDHWALESLALNAGDELGVEGTVVGYECDGCDFDIQAGLPVATGTDGTPANFEILATAPAHLWETSEAPLETLGEDFIGELNWAALRIGGEDSAENRERFTNGHAVLGIFRRGKGQVFTTGCTDWAYGLKTKDVSTVTDNVMRRFVSANEAR
jgi:hypothetical protein